MKTVRVADLFCGAGGTSTGLAQAAAELGVALSLTAVNHWDVAVATHAANHPAAAHHCCRIDAVNLWEFPGRKLDLLVASPECTNHSRARGGKPVNDQSRAAAWGVLDWVQQLQVEHVLIENVPEFEDWGPLGYDGKPLASQRGRTFQAFVSALWAMNYRVEWRRLVAADFGDRSVSAALLRHRRGAACR